MANAASVTRQIKKLLAEYDVDAPVTTRHCGHRNETDRRAGWGTVIHLGTDRPNDRLAAKGAIMVSDIPEIYVSDKYEYFLSVWQPV
jgi:hypothetical protein